MNPDLIVVGMTLVGLALVALGSALLCGFALAFVVIAYVVRQGGAVAREMVEQPRRVARFGRTHES
jgi:divalent metal cation (Fe/Co/Zn/Cd) transporter